MTKDRFNNGPFLNLIKTFIVVYFLYYFLRAGQLNENYFKNYL